MLFKKSNLYNNLIILFLVILFGYILGLSIVNIVDKRLTEISINMPKISIPEQKIYLELKDKNLNTKILRNTTSSIDYDTNNIENFALNKNKKIKVKTIESPKPKPQTKPKPKPQPQKKNELDNCRDVYSKWSKTKNGSKLEKENPNCFKPVNSMRIKNLRNMFDKLKLIDKDNRHCKLIENKLGFVINPKTKNMMHKLFPECKKDQVNKEKTKEGYENFEDQEQEQKQKQEQKQVKGLESDISPELQYAVLNALKRRGIKMGEKQDLEIEFDLNKKNTRSKYCGKKDDPALKLIYDKINETKIDRKREKCGDRLCEEKLLSEVENQQTNYKDPKEMTSEQRQRFKNLLDLSKMTTKDYMNWLELFKKDYENLPDLHAQNLQKLLKKEKLTLSDIPRNLNIDGISSIHSSLNEQDSESSRLMKSIWCASQNKIKEIDLKYIDNLKAINDNNYNTFLDPSEMDKTKIINSDINFKTDIKNIKKFLKPKDSKYETLRLMKLAKNKKGNNKSNQQESQEQSQEQI